MAHLGLFNPDRELMTGQDKETTKVQICEWVTDRNMSVELPAGAKMIQIHLYY